MSGQPPQRRAFSIPGLKRRPPGASGGAAPGTGAPAAAGGAQGVAALPGAAAKRFKSPLHGGGPGGAAGAPQAPDEPKENAAPAEAGDGKDAAAAIAGAASEPAPAAPAAAPAPLAPALARQPAFRPPSLVRPFKPPGAAPAGGADAAGAAVGGHAGAAAAGAGAAARAPEGPSRVFAVLYTKAGRASERAHGGARMGRACGAHGPRPHAGAAWPAGTTAYRAPTSFRCPPPLLPPCRATSGRRRPTARCARGPHAWTLHGRRAAWPGALLLGRMLGSGSKNCSPRVLPSFHDLPCPP
jgi:hypothetical protein